MTIIMLSGLGMGRICGIFGPTYRVQGSGFTVWGVGFRVDS